MFKVFRPKEGFIMATKSKIEWTESTWNPVTGCTKISQGCKQRWIRKFEQLLTTPISDTLLLK